MLPAELRIDSCSLDAGLPSAADANPLTPDPSTLPSRRELARYLEPFIPNFDLLGGIDVASENVVPQEPPDGTLNALCQIGALRTGCKRAMISLVSQDLEFILAEASPNSQLCQGRPRSSEDELWLGMCVLPVAQCFCPWTVSQSRSVQPAAYDHLAAQIPLVINDALQDRVCSQLRLVREKPHIRFYAGVPLISAQGLCIGSYFVLDDKPHPEGLSPLQLAQMDDLAALVLAQIELLRARAELVRSTNLVRGMGRFLDGHHNLGRDNANRSMNGIGARRDSMQGHRSSLQNGIRDQSRQSVEPFRSSSQGSNPLPGQPETIRDLFLRASNIVLESTELEDVCFIDARFSQPKGQIQDGDIADEDPALSETPVETSSGSEGSCERSNRVGSCSVLGFASSRKDVSEDSSSSSPYGAIRDKFLQSLLRQYPYGKVFVSDAEPLPSSESDSNQHVKSVFVPRTNKSSASTSVRPRAVRKRRYSKKQEMAVLKELFPGFRSLVFCPLWDQKKDRWFAAGFAISDQSAREMSDDGTLTYLTTFGNTIMAEVSHLESKRSETAKTDFISSISHELRSPLHGVLGSVELMRDPSNQLNQANLLRDIEIAGRTLLDTVDHLLDYSKINHSGAITASRLSSRTATKSTSESNLRASPTSLSIMAEEVFQTVVTGGEYGTTLRPGYKNTSGSLLTIIDVPPLGDSYVTADSGALRRILTNLCGNAVKYTPNGSVHVKIQSSPLGQRSSDGSALNEVLLTINDTGIGMSKDFMAEKLYTAFAQEDPHSPGTGLGLSIVKQIVRTMRGSINIQSDVGVGTTIKVKLKLPREKSEVSADTEFERKMVDDAKVFVQGRNFCLGGLEDGPSDSTEDETKEGLLRRHHLLRRSLSSLCTAHFDLKASEPANCGSEDLRLVLYESLKESETNFSQNRCRTIVICSTVSEARKVPKGKRIATVITPIGPVRLARAIISLQQPSTPPQTPSEIQIPPAPTLMILPTTTPSPTPYLPTRVLVVDDNAINVRLLATFLSRQKIPHATATNGLEALETFRASFNSTAEDQQHFSHVLMDISMPVMDGMQATREIRHLEEERGRRGSSVLTSPVSPLLPRRKSRIIALTGLGSLHEQEEIMKCGVDVYLSKPVSLKKLKEFLE